MATATQVRTLDPRVKAVDMNLVLNLFASGFKKKKIAEMIGVSISTLSRRMIAAGFQVRDTYAALTQQELNEHVNTVLEEHPNTGSKTMKGFLAAKGLKCKQTAVRRALAEVDPVGTVCRKLNSRVIVRRVYHVRYSNEIWHIDTNLKMIRYKFVVKGAIDGKSRYCVYLDVADNNTAQSQLQSFIKGTETVGVPIRVRSDKGGENRGIAEFMLLNRGLNRGSHICGRSVHNQRIERFWVDTWEKVILQYIVLFSSMEERGLLNINDDLHMTVLHHVFLPRIQQHLDSFRNGWNNHPVSTENSYTPHQLLLMHFHPPAMDLEIAEETTTDLQFVCNSEQDIYRFNEPTALTFPRPPRFQFTEQEQIILDRVNILRESESYGLDVYEECIGRIIMQQTVY